MSDSKTQSDASAQPPAPPGEVKRPIRLHIGGHDAREGWSILNIQQRPGVDYIGNCTDLSQFADGSIEEIYVSHVYEHLSYVDELPKALKEAHRVLRPRGALKAAVPDFEMLARLYLDKRFSLHDRFYIQRMMLGGQIDEFDFHKVGLDFATFQSFLVQAGFLNIKRVDAFGLFEDSSVLKFAGVPISLNVVAIK